MKYTGTHTMTLPPMATLADERSVETKALTKSFGWNSGQQFQQQDVSELFNVLFDALETVRARRGG